MTKGLRPELPVVIVDDEPDVLAGESNILAANGFTNVIKVQDGREVIDTIASSGADLLLLDLSMPEISGRDVLKAMRERFPEVPVIIITGNNDLSTAVQCMQEGATDYMVKAVEASRLVSGVKRALEMRELRRNYTDLRSRLLSDELQHPDAFANIVTQSRKMHSLFLYVESIGRTRETVLVSGETGVGKDLIAEAVHAVSGRIDPFVRVNTAGLDDAMFSDTLFGHRKGAFTGALDARKGLVTQSESGTLFLDEIGDLSAPSQVKLLQLLERREYYPIGSDFPRTTEARFVVATFRNLEEMVRRGEFRKDLYYRLSTHAVRVPPLRERPEDLPSLLDHFLVAAARDLDRERLAVPPQLLPLLRSYDFPGNIREFRSMIYDAVARQKSRMVPLSPFREAMGRDSAAEPDEAAVRDRAATDKFPTLRAAVEHLIDDAIARADGNQAIAAGLLGISPQALSKRLKRRDSEQEA